MTSAFVAPEGENIIFTKLKFRKRQKDAVHAFLQQFSTNIKFNYIFKSAKFCTNLFERIPDKFSRFGLPNSIAQVFYKRPYRSSSKRISIEKHATA